MVLCELGLEMLILKAFMLKAFMLSTIMFNYVVTEVLSGVDGNSPHELVCKNVI